MTSEVAPFSQSGALADVTQALTRAQRLHGHSVSVLSPFYPSVKRQAGPLSRPVNALELQLGRRKVEANLYTCTGHDGVRHFFLDLPGLFDRPGLYGENGEAYADNALRFALLARAAVAVVQQYDYGFDVVHSHNWQAALAPLYRRSVKDASKALEKVAFVLSIHDLTEQGLTPLDEAARLGITKTYLKPGTEGIEYEGQISLLKAGLLHADALTTVSPTYAREIGTPEVGAGLHDVLRERQRDLTGILSGVDYHVWSPENDALLPFHFTEDHQNGKRRCKGELQVRLKLALRPRVPVVGVVSELTEPKGIDLLLDAVRPLLADQQIELALLGSGDASLEASCRALAAEFPAGVGVHIGDDEALAHLVFAGSDIVAVPSRFEPCGLTQLYAMRYGAIPVVHDTGGLRDTVIDHDPNNDQGTGFRFQGATAEALRAALERAVETYHQARRWRQLIAHAMRTDFSWKRAALQYLEVYESVLGTIR